MKEMTELNRRAFKLQIIYEQQSAPYTCAAKALQLVLHFYVPEKFSLGNELEMSILSRAKLGNYDVATHPGLALVALEEGFQVDHLVVFNDVFRYPERNQEGYTMPREEFEEKITIDRGYFKKAQEKGLHTIVVPNITGEILKDYTRRKIPLIVMTDNYGVLHDLIIRGFENNMFKVVDPAAGYKSIYLDNLLRQIHTRYGVSILAISAPSKL